MKINRKFPVADGDFSISSGLIYLAGEGQRTYILRKSK